MWKGAGDRTGLQHIDPDQRCVFLVFLMLNRRPRGSAFYWLSLQHLVSDFSNLQLTDFLSSPSYIIVQLPTQSLEWHVWSSSSSSQDTLFRWISLWLYMGFYLVLYRQPRTPTRFLLITDIRMCHFLPVHHFGMACLAGSKVNIQVWFLFLIA